MKNINPCRNKKTNNLEQVITRICTMNNNKSMHKVTKALYLFILTQSIILLILNIIPIGGEWASTFREWIGITIGLN